MDGISYPVPFGHVPYNPSLPGAMGPIWDFPIEWWYFGRLAQSSSGDEIFTLFFEIIRATYSSDMYTAAVITYGIGSQSQSNYFSANSSFSEGFSPKRQNGGEHGLIIPPTTSKSWYVEARTETMMMTCEMISGILGLSGVRYKLTITDDSRNISAVFMLNDTFSTIFELASGASSNNSYKFALPSLNIESGHIVLNGKQSPLVGGNLWLDRQTLTPRSASISDLESCLSASHQLYTGNWLAVVMNDNTVYVLVFFWPPKKDQWIVGDELVPPVPPLHKTGLKYSPMSDWNGHSPVVGVNVLDSSEFDLNIYKPKDPAQSSHWTSHASKNTYCSKWQLRIHDEIYTMTALVLSSEVKIGTESFFEGAATLANANGDILGHAMVEQMGYTQ